MYTNLFHTLGMHRNSSLVATVSAAIFGGFITIIMVMIAIDKVKEWETLVAGFMSVMAAVWAGYLLHKQINQTEKLENQRQTRKYIAAKSVLPLALMRLSKYSRENVHALARTYGTAQNGAEAESLAIGEVPDDVMKTIEVMIEHTPHANVAARLAAMIAQIQMFHSRLLKYKNVAAHDALDGANLPYLVLSGVIVFTYVDSLFRYSRDQIDYSAEYPLEDIDWDYVERCLIDRKNLNLELLAKCCKLVALRKDGGFPAIVFDRRQFEFD